MSSKYADWYDDIIQRAASRRLDIYFEHHHVLPRSLGGGDEPSNLVDLTYREHFLAHWLLTKIYDGDAKRAMVYALHCMTLGLIGRTISGWQIEIAKRAVKDEVRRTAAIRLDRWKARRDEAVLAAANEMRVARDAGASLRITKGRDRDQVRAHANTLLAAPLWHIRRKPPAKGEAIVTKAKRKIATLPSRKGENAFGHGKPRKRNRRYFP